MMSAETLNLIGFIISFATGSVGAFYIGCMVRTDTDVGPDEHRVVSTSEKKNAKQISINMAVLYATLGIVIASVVSNWPPEGQAFPDFVEIAIFFPAVAASSYIFTRIMIILYQVEKSGVANDL